MTFSSRFFCFRIISKLLNLLISSIAVYKAYKNSILGRTLNLQGKIITIIRKILANISKFKVDKQNMALENMNNYLRSEFHLHK